MNKKLVTHTQQQEVWEKEHTSPKVLLQMDSTDPSSGVVKFYNWLKENKIIKNLKGIEMGCGKGRNCIYLAKQGFDMTGFDFSSTAVAVAKERGKDTNAQFVVQDATNKWNFPENDFDFAIDCFASTDIESLEGRKYAVSEIKRVVKQKGNILVYTLSTDDEFQKSMVNKSPASEHNAFIHSTGKFEKIFNRDELLTLYKGLSIIKEERVEKTATFLDKQYNCYHHWFIFQKS